MRHGFTAVSLSTLALVAAPDAAFAQEAPEPPLLTAAIVVTAQKREQSLQDVPASLTVIDAEAIEFAAGNDLGSVIERTPGAAFIGLGFSGNNSVSLRGLGGLATFGPFCSQKSRRQVETTNGSSFLRTRHRLRYQNATGRNDPKRQNLMQRGRKACKWSFADLRADVVIAREDSIFGDLNKGSHAAIMCGHARIDLDDTAVMIALNAFNGRRVADKNALHAKG